MKGQVLAREEEDALPENRMVSHLELLSRAENRMVSHIVILSRAESRMGLCFSPCNIE